MDISVIIPIYGVEEFVERCLRSLFTQTKSDGVEFILVDDATRDRSMEVAQRVIAEYTDREVKIIHHTQNRGVAAVRQTGIKAASGEYIIHIDSDDWCEPTMLETLYCAAQKERADIVVCDYMVVGVGGEQSVSLVDYNRDDPFGAYIKGDINSQLWNKLIRRDLYNNPDFNRYKIDFNFGEDAAMVLMLFYVASRVSKLSAAQYHYIERAGSLSRTYSPKMCGDLIKMVLFYENFLKNKGLLNHYIDVINTKKLGVKFLILKNSTFTTQRLYFKVFGELTPQIWRIFRFGTYNKIALILASKGWLRCANAIWGVAKIFKHKAR